jgi:phenylacetate-coenzyme A ligase PaaK-like adenylate-forming protein
MIASRPSPTERASSWLVRNLVFPLWARRDHPAFARYVREFERMQFESPASLQNLQFERLRKMLRHAYKNCTFYRQRMDQAGLSVESLNSVEQLSVLPVLTKADIQEHGREMEAANFPAELRQRNQTGGSTGSPLQFYVDKERFASRLASTVRHNRWAGLRPGSWYAVLWGSRLDQNSKQGVWDRLRNDVLYRTLVLNTSCVQERDWIEFIGKLRVKRPRTLLAYTQAAVLFARYLRQQKIDDIHFDCIITTAEVLLPGQREFLQEIFRGKVFNRYGCREVSVIASECEYHLGMHVSIETFFLEIVPHKSIPAPAGRVVITDLLNFSMPLIRYEIGDVAAWAENQQCPCGRHLPLLTEVQGRTTEFLVLQDGRQISGPALTLVVADMSQVKQVQFVQKALNRIVIRIVPGKNYGPPVAEELRRRLGLYVGSRTILEIEETQSIASEISGKYRFAINEMKTQQDLEFAPVQGEENLARG